MQQFFTQNDSHNNILKSGALYAEYQVYTPSHCGCNTLNTVSCKWMGLYKEHILGD
jgi:hypothetical protein